MRPPVSRSPRVTWLFTLALACLTPSLFAQDILVAPGSVWTYLDDGSDQGTAWQAPAYPDGSWDTGPAQLGYGDDDEATTVSFGPNSSDKHITTYYRLQFNVVDPNAYSYASLDIVADDGAIVYLNGSELLATNMPGGVVDSETFASSTVSAADESHFEAHSFAPSLLVAGTNTLAVELHQASASSSDTSFDLRLLGADAPYINRGPYLQRRSDTSITVSWRTTETSGAWVWIGSSPGNVAPHTLGGGLLKHDVQVTGLAPDTQYFYGVGSDTGLLAGGDSGHTFRTAPVPGDETPLRLWVVGDSGTANNDARAVRDAYLAYPGALDTDVWLMLGDNAYNEGTTAQYESAVFATYPDLLRRTTLWPTRGNHDTTGAYFGLFVMPAAGEAGGVASGTENYYSFDQGNVHFICLDSATGNLSTAGPMYSWLESDLASTTQEWIIAFWHHPPYSKGSHDSDTEATLITMRSNFTPLLEDHGVDLVLSGHSHSYERSVLIDSHYGISSTWDPGTMEIDGGDGSPLGDGAYEKFAAPHEGAVYAVPGSSGKLSNGPLDHPIMTVAVQVLGSMVIDIDGPTLDAVFLDSTGTVLDDFRIEHKPQGDWDDLGGGTIGIAGPPVLTGNGIQSPGQPFSIELTDGAPSALCLLFLSVASTPVNAFGGTFHPLPILEQYILFTDPTGSFLGAGSWPASLPPGTEVFYQFAIEDLSVIFGATLSNGLRSTTP